MNKGGKGSFEQVMRGLELPARGGRRLERADHDPRRQRQTHGREVYCFLRDECGARFVQLIPIIERVAEASEDGSVPWSSWRDRPLYTQEGTNVTNRSVTAEQYGRFLIEVFEEWVRRDVGEVYVQMFDVALANWVGEPPGLCIHSETCGLALALEHTGDLYSAARTPAAQRLRGQVREPPVKVRAELVGGHSDLPATQRSRPDSLGGRSTAFAATRAGQEAG